MNYTKTEQLIIDSVKRGNDSYKLLVRDLGRSLKAIKGHLTHIYKKGEYQSLAQIAGHEALYVDPTGPYSMRPYRHCDCRLSEMFDSPEDMRGTIIGIDVDLPTDISRPVPTTDDDLCAFCGYETFYVNNEEEQAC